MQLGSGRAHTTTPHEWQAIRRAYSAKNDLLFGRNVGPGSFYWCDAISFYRLIFPPDFLEVPGRQIDWDEPGGGRPNGIVIELTDEKVMKKDKNGALVERPLVKRHMLTDNLDGTWKRDEGEDEWVRRDEDDLNGFDESEIRKLINEADATNHSMFVAPVSYFGKSRSAANARFLHAFTVDLDGVGLDQLANLLKQIRNGHESDARPEASLPQPSAIVNSGNGVHLYYILDEPVPLVPRMVPFLQEIKHRLVDLVWTSWTSTIEERQYQGIFQSFRMVETPTKLNGKGPDAKATKYMVEAFCYEVDGHPWKVTLDYLLKYISVHDKKAMDLLAELKETGGRTPLAIAKEKWPDWYQRRIIDGKEPGRWYANRALYDWWLRTISDTSKVTYRHRYWCVHELAAFADKCGVPLEELEEDAYGLVELYDSLTEDDDNHFTVEDVASALDNYGDGKIHRHSKAGIRRRTQIDIPDTKRNGRTRDVHLAGARAIQEINDKFNGTDWREGNGRKPKGAMVLEFAKKHPNMSHAAMARELGVSRTTVIKWLRAKENDSDKS